MRSVFVLSLALLAPFVATESISDRVNALQGCQKDCLTSALQDANCGGTDLACGCDGASSASLSLKLAGCAAPASLGGKGCTDVKDALALSASVCGSDLEDIVTSGAADLVDIVTSNVADLKSAVTSGASVVLSHASATLNDLTANPTATGTSETPAAAPPQITGALWAGLGVGALAMMAL